MVRTQFPILMSSFMPLFSQRISSLGHKVNWLASRSSFIASSHFAHRVQGPIPFHSIPSTHPSIVCLHIHLFSPQFHEGASFFLQNTQGWEKKISLTADGLFLAHVSCVVNNHILLPFPPPFKRKQTNQFISPSHHRWGKGGEREKSDYRYFCFVLLLPSPAYGAR